MGLSSCATKTNRHGRELVEHGTAFFPAACYFDDLAREPVPWHWHDELEAVVVSEGRAVVTVGKKKYTIEEGDGFFINAGVLHGAWRCGDGGCRFHSVVFHPRLVGGGIDSVFWQKYLQPLLTDSALRLVCFTCESDWQRRAISSIEEAWNSCVNESPGYEFTARAALSQLIFLLCSHRTVVQSPPADKAQRDGERIKCMLQYVQEHYAEELSAAQIAASAMISESECLRCFRSTIGTTPIQYVKQFRIQRAAELLSSTGEKVAEIGARCGFQEMSYFARCFRELKGCTPREYRAACAGKGQAQDG